MKNEKGCSVIGDDDIVRGDSSKLLKCLPDGIVDMIIADPPYGIEYFTNKRKSSTIQGGKGIYCDTSECIMSRMPGMIDDMERVMKQGSHLYLFTKWNKIHEFYPLVDEKFNVKNVLVWKKNKSRGGMGDLKGSYANQYEAIIYAQKGRKELNCTGERCRHPDIIEFNRPQGNEHVHANQKPEKLIEFLVKKSSNPGDVVLDPFLGSGTTCVVAKNTGRKCIGFEIDPETFKIATERLR